MAKIDEVREGMEIKYVNVFSEQEQIELRIVEDWKSVSAQKIELDEKYKHLQKVAFAQAECSSEMMELLDYSEKWIDRDTEEIGHLKADILLLAKVAVNNEVENEGLKRQIEAQAEEMERESSIVHKLADGVIRMEEEISKCNRKLNNARIIISKHKEDKNRLMKKLRMAGLLVSEMRDERDVAVKSQRGSRGKASRSARGATEIQGWKDGQRNGGG